MYLRVFEREYFRGLQKKKKKPTVITTIDFKNKLLKN